MTGLSMLFSLCFLLLAASPLQAQSPKDDAQHPFALNAPGLVLADTWDEGIKYQSIERDGLQGYRMRWSTPSLCDPDVKQASGYLDVARGDHIFFWFFEARHDPENAPLILWLNGGPGASSFTGLLFELGPCRVLQNGTGTARHAHSWNERANIIFIDQPLSVGYSYSENGTVVATSERAAEDIWFFLQLFFYAFPQYSKLPFHAAGESYGGHYIPAIASEIHKRNVARAGMHVNLESLVIGNGWMDPLVQTGVAVSWICNGPYSDKLVDSPTGEMCQRLLRQAHRCQALISRCYEHPSRLTCVPATLGCDYNPWQKSPIQDLGLNPYDVRKPCIGTGVCYEEMVWIGMYLNRDDIKEELGVPASRKFVGHSSTTSLAFALSGDGSKNFAPLLPPLLDAGIRILNYAGRADSVCDYKGNYAWMKKMNHTFAKELAATKPSQFQLQNGTVVGFGVTVKNLTYLAINEAGHMVPFDQPEATREMIERWIAREPLMN